MSVGDIHQSLFDMNMADQNYKQAMLYAGDSRSMRAALDQLDSLELDYVPRDEYEAVRESADRAERVNDNIADRVQQHMNTLSNILATWQHDMNQDARRHLQELLLALETTHENSEL